MKDASDVVLQLADLANLTQPWCIDSRYIPTGKTLPSFKGPSSNAPISLEELEREYATLLNQSYPITEMVFVRSWMLFRVSNSFVDGNIVSILTLDGSWRLLRKG